MSDAAAPPPTDWAALAARLSLAEFVAAAPKFFLVGSNTVTRAVRPQRTIMAMKAPTPEDFEELTSRVAASEIAASSDAAPPSIVLAVHKIQPVFPSMITIGRTNNNDLVVPDVSVSRFHAYFKIEPGSAAGPSMELVDAASRNGSFVGGRKLGANGPGIAVVAGDIVRFGNCNFDFLEAADTWRRLHRRRAGFDM